MSKVEIEIESGDNGCGGDCKCGGEAKDKAPSKDALIAELKKLLDKADSTNVADRQMKVDELIKQIAELEED